MGYVAEPMWNRVNQIGTLRKSWDSFLPIEITYFKRFLLGTFLELFLKCYKGLKLTWKTFQVNELAKIMGVIHKSKTTESNGRTEQSNTVKPLTLKSLRKSNTDLVLRLKDQT